VFAVTQADPTGPLALPRTEADEIASTIPELTSTSSATRLSTTSTALAAAQPTGSASNPAPQPGFEDEDMELQAVLQASLMGGQSNFMHAPSLPPLPSLVPAYGPIPGSWPTDSGSRDSSGSDSGAGTPTHRVRHPYGAPGDPPNTDRVAASTARNRAIMERMRREQEMAQRELYEEEIARHGARAAASAEQEDEADMLRHAIAESRALAKVEGHGQADDEEEDQDSDIAGVDRQPEYRLPPMAESQQHVRVYDDYDEQLQRALKASLEAVPQGFVMPDLQPEPARTRLDGTQHEDSEDMETSSEAEASVASISSSDATQEPEVVSVDEIRKKRLARFGA